MKKLFFALSLLAISSSAFAMMDVDKKNTKESNELLMCNAKYKKWYNAGILAECIFDGGFQANNRWKEKHPDKKNSIGFSCEGCNKGKDCS